MPFSKNTVQNFEKILYRRKATYSIFAAVAIDKSFSMLDIYYSK